MIGVDGDCGGPGDFCFNERAHLTETDVPAYEERLPELMASWERLWAPDRPIRVEKPPPNLILSRFLQAVFNDARFVFIVWHPLATARATQKRSHASGEHLHWLQGHRVMMEDVPIIN